MNEIMKSQIYKLYNKWCTSKCPDIFSKSTLYDTDNINIASFPVILQINNFSHYKALSLQIRSTVFIHTYSGLTHTLMCLTFTLMSYTQIHISYIHTHTLIDLTHTPINILSDTDKQITNTRISMCWEKQHCEHKYKGFVSLA